MTNNQNPNDAPSPDDLPQESGESIEDTSEINETVQFGESDAEAPSTPDPNADTVDFESPVPSPADGPDLAADDAGSIEDTAEWEAASAVKAGESDSAADDENEKTVSAADIEETVQGPLPGDDPVADKTHLTVDAEIDQTVGLESTSNFGPVGSVMEDSNIGQTINPREMSDKDAEFWGNISSGFASAGEASQLAPAIERSLSETKLRLTDRALSTPRSDPDASSDYRLVRLLGKGGMGNVFVARQSSLDRLIAVKVIKPLSSDKRKRLKEEGKLERMEQNRREQFLSEAVVTGDLDHPNIVPIHDVAVTGDKTLFYAMKRVIGTPWNKSIDKMSRDENVDTLLKVADAIGFAHTRGVIHRDIKPENIMLGDFGVVMVMDWGIALAKPEFEKRDSITAAVGLGGTPAFMSPEMATGPVEAIGRCSDIYLLGATLYMIITGSPPHKADNVAKCLRAVATNEIQPVAPEHEGELLQIAMKAMATRPEDRYATVQDFQAAVREYRAHSESIALTVHARDDLKSAQESGSYESFSKATFGFEQALTLWTENKPASAGLDESRLANAQLALQRGDYELGLSVLSEDEPAHQELRGELREALRERDARHSRLRIFKVAAAAMLAMIVIGGTVGGVVIEQQRRIAVDARDLADRSAEAAVEAQKDEKAQRKVAEYARAVADVKTAEAVRDRKAADAARNAADAARNDEEKARMAAVAAEMEAVAAKDEQIMLRDEADREKAKAIESENEARVAEEEAQKQRGIATYESYLSQIGLAKARIDSNEFRDARRILAELAGKDAGYDQNWEWRWLNTLVNQAESVVDVKDAIANLVVDHSGRRAYAVLDDGSLGVMTLSPAGQATQANRFRLPSADDISAVAVSDSDQLIAIGTIFGGVELWDANLQQRLVQIDAHEGLVTAVEFAGNQMLVSGSVDRTVRAWPIDAVDGTLAGRLSEAQLGIPDALATCWQLTSVRAIDLAVRDGSCLVAAAVSDNTIGRVELWRLGMPVSGDRSSITAENLGVFLDHEQPVSAVAINGDGSQVASGDESGEIFLWKTADAKLIDIRKTIAAAVANVDGDSAASTPRSPGFGRSSRQPYRRLSDRQASDTIQLVSTDSVVSVGPAAHTNVVRSLQFSGDGSRVLSGGDDYLIHVWQTRDPVSDQSPLTRTLRGHGGWVTAARFTDSLGTLVTSGATDGTVRTWSLANAVASGEQRSGQRREAHADEIWSAQFSSDGKRVVTASRDHTARVLAIDGKLNRFTESATLSDRESGVSPGDGTDSDLLAEGSVFVAMSMFVDEPHRRLYVGGADSTVRVWDLSRGTEVGSARGTGLNSSLAVSRNGRVMLTGSSSPDAKAILWRLDPESENSPQEIRRLGVHQDTVTALAVSNDERYAFTGDRSGIGVLWNAQTGAQIGPTIMMLSGSRINDATFSAGGNELLLAADNRQVTRLDVDTRRVLGSFPHDGLVTALSLSTDNSQMVTVTEQASSRELETKAVLWDLATEQSRVIATGKVIRDGTGVRTSQRRVVSASFGQQSGVLTVGIRKDDSTSDVAIWDTRGSIQDGKPSQAFRLPGRLSLLTSCVPLRGGKLITLNGDAGFLWDLDSLSHEKSFRAHGALTSASFSADGRYVVTASRSLKVWDSASGTSLAKVEVPHDSTARAVAFTSQAGSYIIASGGDDGLVKIWNWDPQATEIKFSGQLGEAILAQGVLSLRFSPDGTLLLVTGKLGLVKLWNVAAGNVVMDYSDDTLGTVQASAFSPDGRQAIIAGNDLAMMWDLKDPESSPLTGVKFRGHAGRIEGVSIWQSADSGMRVFTASRDKTARVWDPLPAGGITGVDGSAGEDLAREVVVLRGHKQGLTAIDVTADGMAMTAGRDGQVVLWPAQ